MEDHADILKEKLASGESSRNEVTDTDSSFSRFTMWITNVDIISIDTTHATDNPPSFKGENYILFAPILYNYCLSPRAEVRLTSHPF